MSVSTWVLSLATIATAVFNRQIGSLVKWIDCNVMVVNVVSTDTFDVSWGGLVLLLGGFELLLDEASLLLVQRLVWRFFLHCRHHFFEVHWETLWCLRQLKHRLCCLINSTLVCWVPNYVTVGRDMYVALTVAAARMVSGAVSWSFYICMKWSCGTSQSFLKIFWPSRHNSINTGFKYSGFL